MYPVARLLPGLAIVAGLVAGCAEEAGNRPPPAEGPAELSGWLTLVYAFGGDEETASRDEALERLRATAAPGDGEVLVETGAGDGSLHRARLADGAWVEEDPARAGAMATPAELADFIAFAATRFPNRHLALVVRGRGYGVRGLGGAGTGADGGILPLPGLVEAVAGGLEAIGRDRLELIALDASFTSSVETALGLVGKADFFLGWQGPRPAHGLALEGLVGSGESPGMRLLAATESLAAARDTLSDMTLALLLLEPLGRIANGFETLRDKLPVLDCPICLLRFGAAVPRPGAMPDPADTPHDVDLGSVVYLGLRATDGGSDLVWNGAVFDGFQIIDDTLRGAVLASAGSRDNEFLERWRGSGGAAGLQIAHGVSLEFPLLERDLDPAYATLPWMRSWLEALRETWHLGEDGPALEYVYVTGLEVLPLYYFLALRDTDSWYFQVQHRTRYGLSREDGTTVLLGDEWAPSDAEDFVWAGWTGNGLEVEQDGTRSWTYLHREGPASPSDGATPLLRLPFAYRSAETAAPERIAIQVRFDPLAQPEELRVRFLHGGRDGWAEFTPAPGSRIRPLLRVLDADGTQRFVTADVDFAADRSLNFRETKPEPGTPFVLSLQPHGPLGTGAEASCSGTL
jgi:hypothetical protein